jgi:hypothetical protein
MIRITFPNIDAKRQALGRLAGRFPFKSWATGEMLVPEAALSYLGSRESHSWSNDRSPIVQMIS